MNSVLRTMKELVGAAAAALCFALVASALNADDRVTDPESQPGVLLREFIYETAPFPECHASTIAETQGTLIAAWFGGTQEKAPDVGIWLSRLEDGKWTDPVEVANGVQKPEKDGTPVRYPTWNP